MWPQMRSPLAALAREQFCCGLHLTSLTSTSTSNHRSARDLQIEAVVSGEGRGVEVSETKEKLVHKWKVGVK